MLKAYDYRRLKNLKSIVAKVQWNQVEVKILLLLLRLEFDSDEELRWRSELQKKESIKLWRWLVEIRDGNDKGDASNVVDVKATQVIELMS